jgi:hypothetical protein
METPVFFQNTENTSEFFDDGVVAENVPSINIASMSLEKFRVIAPDLYSAVFAEGKAEGRATEREQIDRLKKVCGKNMKLLGECVTSEKVAAEVLENAADKFECENRKMTSELENIEERKALKNLTEKQLRSKYDTDQDLQNEFHSVEAYLCYVRREIKSQQ